MKKQVVQKKVVKKKLVPIPKLKTRLWIIFSLYIKLRDCDSMGILTCCATGRKGHIWGKETKWNSGHFFCKEGNPALMFMEENVHSQWSISNMKMKRNITWDYTEFMLTKYGLNRLRYLASLRGVDFKFTRPWLEDKIKYYQEKITELKQLKGL